MINFSTEFPLAATVSTDDVLLLACEWVLGSPHTCLDEDAFHDLPENDSITIENGPEKGILGSVAGDNYKMSGLQYIKADRGLNWTTSIVARQENEQVLFSVQVACESLGTSVHLPAAKKPFIIKQVITALGGGNDGEIPVADKPFVLEDQHVHAAAALIKGKADNKLPIIYISSGFDGSPPIDARRLAPFVSGLAHVIVEPSREFSAQLRGLVDGRNVYGGTIGVYWPQSSARRSYYLGRYDDDPVKLQRAISDDIQKALANRRLTTSCTWLNLQEELSRTKLNFLRKDGSSSLEDYVSAFDSEIKAKEQRISEADREIQKLKAELRLYSSNTGSDSGTLLELGAEQDLYPQEIKNAVVKTLQEVVPNLRDDSRRLHIVSDLINANELESTTDDMKEQVKSTLHDFKKMDSKNRSQLESLGFDISDDGKHYKLVFRGDSRYKFTLPKTGSDHRGGKNAASDIINTLF